MASGGVTGSRILGFHIGEFLAKRRTVAQQNCRDAAAQELIINGCRRIQAINRHDKQTINATGKKSTNRAFLPVRKIQRMSQEQVITQSMSLLFNGHHRPGVDRAGGRRNDQPEYPISVANWRTRALGPTETSEASRNTLETVITETPALTAMSFRRIIGLVPDRITNEHR